jgi:aryl carrier-like protein
MVPQVYLALDSIPLSSNGKLDRRRLPAPPDDVRIEAALVPAETDMERRLLEVWKRTLGARSIGVTDDFFSHGGDSIRAITLAAQARSEGIEFSVKDLFVHPTIRSLAAAVGAGGLERIQTVVPEAFDLVTAEEMHALLNEFS